MNGPDGKKFPRGRIVETHAIGDIQIVESHNPGREDAPHAKTSGNDFTVYVGGAPTGYGSKSLDGALLLALAHKYDGKHSQAAHWMARLIGLKEGP